jgi:hypothetical protein
MLGCAAVITWAAMLSVTDIRLRRLPNALTLPGARGRRRDRHVQVLTAVEGALCN